MAARWFKVLGKCQCGKRATGYLMSDRNDELWASCLQCAERSIEREQEAMKEFRRLSNDHA